VRFDPSNNSSSFFTLKIGVHSNCVPVLSCTRHADALPELSRPLKQGCEAMKQLILPALICLLIGAGSVVALEVEPVTETQPEPSLRSLQASIESLQQQVAELKLESSRQSALIKQQADLIARLEQGSPFRTVPVNTRPTFPTYTPQTPRPYQNLLVPPQQWWNGPEIEHPSAAIPNMPKGTQQRWINGMPFYFVPCTTSVQTAFTSPAPATAKAASSAGALILPGEVDSPQTPGTSRVPAP